jgi:hypothetical protein
MLLTDIPGMLLPDQPVVNPGEIGAAPGAGARAWKTRTSAPRQVPYESASAAM